MKRIILITPAYPLRGGLASFGERLATEFQQLGHQVEIYTFSLQYPDFLFPGKTQYSEDAPPQHLNIQVKINSINPLNWWKVGNEIRRQEVDLVICAFWLPFMGPCLGTISRQIRKNKATQIVGLVHNIIPHEKRFGDRPFANYFVQANDGFVALSQSVVEELHTFDATKPVKCVPHPIYDNYGEILPKKEAKAHLNLDQNQSYLLFFGFIRDYKGLDLLLDAMQDERIRTLGIKLIIAGEFYGNEEAYQAQIKRLGVGEQLELRTHFISNEEVKYYFSAADLLVQPYRSATQSGISQLGYHFEVPMVVTKVGGLPEIVEDGKAGYVVDVNAESVANAIVDFYQNNRETSLKKGVQAAKKRFSWSNLADAFLNL
ncbi:MAG: glycosyltransferase [Bacteroidota bacterium]